MLVAARTNFEAYQWFSHETTPHEQVRRTSYSEVGDLCKSSGCSPEEPYWQWSSCGVLEGPSGRALVKPSDFVVTSHEGLATIMDELTFAVHFKETFVRKGILHQDVITRFRILHVSGLDLRIDHAYRVVTAPFNRDTRIVVATRTDYIARKFEEEMLRDGRRNVIRMSIEMSERDVSHKFSDFQDSDNAVLVMPHYIVQERFSPNLEDTQLRPSIITSTSSMRSNTLNQLLKPFIGYKEDWPQRY